jgi:threonine dehydrogenase-like Zn-dependent dehydrogenase
VEVLQRAGIAVDWSKASAGPGGAGEVRSNDFVVERLALGTGADSIVEANVRGVAIEGSVSIDTSIKLGDCIAVFGLGAIGLLAAQMARLEGASRVYGVDLIASRRELARRYGVDETLDPAQGDVALHIKRSERNKGVDAALEISGSYAALQQAIRCVQVGGVVVAASYYKGSAAALSLGAEWHHNRPTLISSMAVWGCPHRAHPLWSLERLEDTAIGLLERGMLSTEGMVTHRIPYPDAARAYELIATHADEAIKVVLTY